MMRPDRQDYEYDVCLSFAGEQRTFVEGVASLLRERRIRVFYDAYEKANLWGKDLYEHLDYVYRLSAAYCVIFVSADYAAKIWTNHERKSAQARALLQSDEYLLPVRFDDTELPGLRPTVGYIDLRVTNHEDLTDLIIQKVTGTREPRTQAAGTAAQTRSVIHNPHILLGDVPLSSRANELGMLREWFDHDSTSALCVVAPGGQGKSALAWTFFQQSTAHRLWHGFGSDSDNYESLGASLRSLVGRLQRSDTIPDIDTALDHLDDSGAFIVLDGVEHLFGTSTRLLDIASDQMRTIADIRMEGLIRRLAMSPSTRVLVTSRQAPALIDDPAIMAHVRRLDLGAIQPHDSPDFWRAMGVNGALPEYGAAAASLRGNALLMRIAGRWVIARGHNEVGIREWINAYPDFLDTIQDHEEFQRVAFVEVIRDVVGPERQMLLSLAAARRQLKLDDWLALSTAFTQSGEERIQFRVAPGELLARGLVHRHPDGRYEMHEILAEAVLRSAADEDIQRIHDRLDEQYGRRLFLPGDTGKSAAYDHSSPIESVQDVDREIGYFLSLLDRDLLRDAAHVFGESLQNQLRFRLGELRVLQSLIAQFSATCVRMTGHLPHRYDYVLSELAVLDCQPDEALRLLPAENDSSETSRLRAEAFMQKGEFPDAYRCAQDACYLALRRWSLVEAADYTGFQMMGNLPSRDAVQALIDLGLGFRTLSRALSQNGYDRAAGLVAIAAVGLVEGSDQPGITSMVYEAFGHVALNAGLAAEASACADRAAAEAAEFKVTEHILNAQFLQLSIRARNRETASLSSDLSELAANAAQKGFGTVARDCIRLSTELGVAPPWMLQAAHGRYQEQAVPTRGGSDSLLYELRALRPLHPLGRWLEFKLLRWLDSYRNELPDIVWTFSEQQLGSWAACSSSLDDDIGAGEHDGFLRILDEDESDEDMLDIMAGAFSEGGSEDVYRRARAGVYHAASSHRLRRCLLSSAKRNGTLDDAVGVLLDIADRQVEIPPISRDVANALREAGNYQVAALVADAGHRAGNIMMSGGGPDITTIIGFGLDLVQLGLDPAGILSAVEDGFKGKPLVYRHGHRSQDALSGSLKFVGGRKGDVGDRFVTMSGVMDQMYEQQMAAANLAIEDGSAPQLAIAAFAHYLRQPYQLIVSADLDAVGSSSSALGMIHGHDEAVMTMTLYLRTDGH